MLHSRANIQGFVLGFGFSRFFNGTLGSVRLIPVQILISGCSRILLHASGHYKLALSYPLYLKKAYVRDKHLPGKLKRGNILQDGSLNARSFSLP